MERGNCEWISGPDARVVVVPCKPGLILFLLLFKKAPFVIYLVASILGYIAIKILYLKFG